MRFKDVFSIIGPPMIGPSSSHTAGAVRIGKFARQLFGDKPHMAEVTLYGSFAETYRGHGTDLALAGGILGYGTDDSRIPDSLLAAAAEGIEITFVTGRAPAKHPNTVHIQLVNSTHQTTITGASIGGGSIEISKVDGFDVKISGLYPTLLIWHKDRPGFIADISAMLHEHRINIGFMQLDRKGRSGTALTVIEADDFVKDELMKAVATISSVSQTRLIHLEKERRR